MRKPELVLPGAPALDPGFLRSCAYRIDADLAVYIGVAEMSARPDVCAFELSQVREYVRRAKDEGMRVFAALNAELSDERQSTLPDTAHQLLDAGISGLIVSEIPVIEQLCKMGMPVHASSLTPIHNTASLAVLKSWGVRRTVLTTVLNWSQIEALAAAQTMDLELIVAGGVCLNDCSRCGLPHDMGPEGLLVGCKQSRAEGFDRPLWLPHADPARIVQRARALGIHSLKIEGRSESATVVAARIRGVAAALTGSFEQGDWEKGPGLYEY